MIDKIKNSIIFKWTLKIWLILFIGFLYTQYTNIHTHSFNGRTITHSHYAGDQSEAGSHQHDDHSHTKSEFFYYSLISGILASLLVVALFFLFFEEKKRFHKRYSILEIVQYTFNYKALRAPPVL